MLDQILEKSEIESRLKGKSVILQITCRNAIVPLLECCRPLFTVSSVMIHLRNLNLLFRYIIISIITCKMDYSQKKHFTNVLLIFLQSFRELGIILKSIWML